MRRTQQFRSLALPIATWIILGLPALAQETEKLSRGQKVGMWKPVPAKQQLEKRTIGGAHSPQGPGPATSGQVEGITGGHVTGAVECFAVHPASADTVYAGGVNGGIFKSTNATAGTPSWTQQFDAKESLSVMALEFDPSDGTNNTLAAGVGTRSSFYGIGGSSTGVWRTTDGGSTWTQAGAGMAGRKISAVAPRGTTLVAAVDSAASSADRGIWRTTDTGGIWTQELAGQAYDMAADPMNATQLFCSITTGASLGIWRSTDTGDTWTKVSDAPVDAFLGASPVRVELAVGRAGSADIAAANVFVAIVSSGGTLAALYRSANSGTSWTAMDLPGVLETTGTGAPAFVGIHPGGQGSIHLSLAAHPTSHTVCFIGGDRQPMGVGDTGSWPNSSGASNYTGRIFRVDGALAPGAQYAPITHCGTGIPLPSGCKSTQRTVSNSAPHADSRELRFDAAGDLLESDDGGIYKHTDPDSTTGDWFSLNGNLVVNEQHSTAYDAVSNIVFSGNQDTGTTIQSATGSATWSSYMQGDGGDVVVGENDPIAAQSTRYMSYYYLYSALRQTYNAANATVGGFTYLALSPLGGDPAPSAQFYTPVAINNVTPTRLIFGCGNGVYESSDRGATVDQISTHVINSGGRDAIAYGAVGNADVLYYGSSTSVYVRTAAPPTAPAASAAYPGGYVYGISVDPDDPLSAVVIDIDQVFFTDNGGTSWTDITGNLGTFLPATLRSVVYLKGDPGKDGIAVGTDRGVYVSLETGSFVVWDTLGTGLPNAPVYELSYSFGDDTLVAGTLGRGAFSLSPIIANLPVSLDRISVE